MDKLRHTATWTDDCQGKKDFDGIAVGISCRYWPGYATVFNAAEPEKGLHTIRTGSPSARATLYINHGEATRGYWDAFILAAEDFAADTEDEVRRQVEGWVESQFDRMVAALRKEFSR